MNIDIERLRLHADRVWPSAMSTAISQAADEIEWLRTERDTLRSLVQSAVPIVGRVARGKDAAFVGPYPDVAARRWMGQFYEQAALDGGEDA